MPRLGQDHSRPGICSLWLGANGWLGNFDSLMRPDNFQRMIEGAYSKKPSAPAKLELTAQQLRERAEWFIRHGQPENADECRKKAIALEQRQAA